MLCPSPLKPQLKLKMIPPTQPIWPSPPQKLVTSLTETITVAIQKAADALVTPENTSHLTALFRALEPTLHTELLRLQTTLLHTVFTPSVLPIPALDTLRSENAQLDIRLADIHAELRAAAQSTRFHTAQAAAARESLALLTRLADAPAPVATVTKLGEDVACAEQQFLRCVTTLSAWQRSPPARPVAQDEQHAPLQCLLGAGDVLRDGPAVALRGRLLG